MSRSAWALGIAALACATASAAPVRFVVNDALLKDELLPGVTVRVAASDAPSAAALTQGTTGPDGVFSAELEPGTYYVSYSKPGYVRIQRTPTQITGAENESVVTSLALSLEAEGLSADTQRVKIVLNWGSTQGEHPPDLDSHLLHVETETHVYFGQKDAGTTRELQLDVDDIDWGGPETITLTSPPAGTYYYWVHNFSGFPAIHGSQAVVRVFAGDSLHSEYRPDPSLTDEELTAWRPFAAIHVSEGSITVTDWLPGDLERDPKAAYRPPPGVDSYVAQESFTPSEPIEVSSICCTLVSLLFALAAVGLGLRSMLKS